MRAALVGFLLEIGLMLTRLTKVGCFPWVTEIRMSHRVDFIGNSTSVMRAFTSFFVFLYG